MRDSHVFDTVRSLQDHLARLDKQSKIAFVPTMGALHHGHLNLVKQAFNYADVVVVSIFVNPTQFNNKEDLEKYPRSIEQDVELLGDAGNVIVFAPTESEVYPSDFKSIQIDLGHLEHVLEGEFRPGHFQGVVTVVSRLFDIVQPNFALFGLKDFQQLAVIQRMSEQFYPNITIVACETVRESSGLASSSRNLRLNENQLEDAVLIYKTLQLARQLSGTHSPSEVLEACREMFVDGTLRLEYLEIVHPKDLLPITEWVHGARMCIAAWCGDVRLIDNDAIRFQ